MTKNLLPKIAVFLFLLFAVGSCQPDLRFNWRFMGWRCQTGIEYRGVNYYCR
ncbi:MAG: hypothetical protein ACFCAD_28125 [Pleurocapsa sp.]